MVHSPMADFGRLLLLAATSLALSPAAVAGGTSPATSSDGTQGIWWVGALVLLAAVLVGFFVYNGLRNRRQL